jgi:hypothetical protein
MSDSGDEGPRQWEPPEGGTQPPPPYQQPSNWPPPPPGAPPPAAGYPYGYQPPQAYGYGQQTEGTAVAALVLAIASFVICPVLPAIAALIVGANARKKITQSGGQLGGLGLVTAATIVAWINIGLAVLTIVAIILIAVFSDPNTSSTTVDSIGIGLRSLL